MQKIRMLFIALFALTAALSAGAVTPVPLPVTGNVSSITGGAVPYAAALIELQNCASPIAITGYSVIVQQAYQLQANASGNVNAAVWPNDIINCNSTTGNSQYMLSWIVNGAVQGTPQCYQVASTQGAWNLLTQQPVSCSQSPPNPQDGQFRNVNVTGCLSVQGGACGSISGPFVPLTGNVTMTGPLGLSTDQPVGNQAADANAAVITKSVLAFGARPDRQPAVSQAETATLSSGSNVVAIASGVARFNCSTDVGKSIVFTKITSGNPNPFSGSSPYVLTITGCTDTTHVTVGLNAAANTTVNLKWGTDFVPPMNSCLAAVKALGGGVCSIPAGSYLAATSPYYQLLGASDDGGYFTTSGGSGASLTAVMASSPIIGQQIASITVNSGGTGYTPNSQLQVQIVGSTSNCPSNIFPTTGPCGFSFALANTNGAGVVTSVTMVSNGYGYTSAPTVNVVPLEGDGATATVTVSGGSINSTNVTAPGAGYLPSDSSLQAWGVGGTGCANLGGGRNDTVTAAGTATTNASGGVISIAWSNTGSGCTGAPTVIFGPAKCSGGQCSNLAPLNPIAMPVQIMVTSGVSIQGAGDGAADQATIIDSVWDGLTTANQPSTFGGDLTNMEISNLKLEDYFVGFAFPFNASYSQMHDVSWDYGALGMWTGSADLGSRFHDLIFFGYSSWVIGGEWSQRVDAPYETAGSGFMNQSQTDRIIVSPFFGYGPTAAMIDNWFATVIYGQPYSQLSTDFGETCASPLTANQRQTGPNIPPGILANNMCYGGITGSMLTSFNRGGAGQGAGRISQMTGKGLSRYMFYGDAFQFNIEFLSCESCAPIGSGLDPYRNASVQEGGIVFRGTSSNGVGAAPTFYSINWANGTVSHLLYSVPNGTQPFLYANYQQLKCLIGCSLDSYLAQNNLFGGLNLQGSGTLTAGNGVFGGGISLNAVVAPSITVQQSGGASQCTYCAIYIGSTLPTWNSSIHGGADIGINHGGPNNAADFLDFHNNGGPSLFKVDASGNTTTASLVIAGTTMSAVPVKIAASITPGAATVSTCTEQTGFTFTGLSTSQNAIGLTPPSTLGIHLWVPVNGLRISAANTLAITFCADATGGTPPAGSYTVTAF